MGPLASKPVMEEGGPFSKVLPMWTCFTSNWMRRSRRILSGSSSHRLYTTSVAFLNLEDIKAPECFVIEQALVEEA